MDLSSQNRTHHVTQDSMAKLPNYFRWTYGGIEKYVKGTVLELGCGAGLGIEHYAAKSDRVYAVDHNQKLLTQLDSRCFAAPVTTISSDLTGSWHELGDLRANTIIMMDVLEHFEDDHLFMKKALGFLDDNGRIIVKVPANSALYGNTDKASGHYRRYDDSQLESLAHDLGLEIERMKHINPLGALAYRFKRHRSSSFSGTFTPWQLTAINQAIPLIQLLDAIPGASGLSTLCVMRKIV